MKLKFAINIYDSSKFQAPFFLSAPFFFLGRFCCVYSGRPGFSQSDPKLGRFGLERLPSEDVHVNGTTEERTFVHGKLTLLSLAHKGTVCLGLEFVCQQKHVVNLDLLNWWLEKKNYSPNGHVKHGDEYLFFFKSIHKTDTVNKQIKVNKS